jgi:hypothetical protein
MKNLDNGTPIARSPYLASLESNPIMLTMPKPKM